MLTPVCHGQLYQKRMARAYNKKVRPRRFEVGQSVLKRVLPHQVKAKGNFSPNWQGPFIVKRVLPNGALYLTDINGKMAEMAINADAVKIYYDASSDPTDREQKKEVTEESPPVESQDASSDRTDSGRPSDLDSVTAREGSNSSDVTYSLVELEKLKKEMKMMETALQGVARQAQAKADEIAKLKNENEQLKAVIKDLRRKSNDADESLREEYHRKVSALDRKVYALTKERDTLRREQNKKSDAAALL
ncbi:Golgin candidate 5 [Capsicum chinense]|nr:Golgin candidate 5 [Capsicum chinense]